MPEDGLLQRGHGDPMHGDPEVDEDMEEEEPVTQVHSLDGATWRDMRIGDQSAGDLFQRVQPRHWPAISAFSFGGLLGGGTGGMPSSDDQEGDGVADPWWRFVGKHHGARAWVMVAGVALAVFVAVSLSGGDGLEGDKSPLSAGTPRHRAPNEGGGFSKPSPLEARLQDVADAALAEGITLPMHTTFMIVRAGPDKGDAEGVVSGGMDFIVSVISSDALEAKAAVATPPSTAASSDPFDSRVLDPRMIVQDLPPSHSLVLNKFNTIKNHALIITKEFQPQEGALTEADFVAWYKVVEELPAVGFFNSAVEAGASQRHKHMQVIPEDALWDYRPEAPEAIPVDEPISRVVGSSRNLQSVWKIPEFEFQHAFTLLPTAEELDAMPLKTAGDAGSRMGAYLRDRYVALLGEVGFDTSAILSRSGNAGEDSTSAVPSSSLPPYNAILTARWLMLVPRSTREWGGIDVNGMGFLGALLAREKAFEGEGAGVFAVLEGVTFPAQSG